MSLTIEINNQEIREAGHAAEIAFCRAMATDRLICDGLVAVTIGLVDPILNVVIDTRVDEKDIHEKINIAADFFKQHQVSWSWIVDPSVKPSNLTKYLEEHDILFLDQFPSLYFDLNKPLPDYPLQQFDIRSAPQSDDLREWIKPVCASFPSSDNAEGFRKLAARLPHGVGTTFRHIMVWHQDTAVASGTLFAGPGNSAMIHNLATLPDYRNQGLATALTLHAMQEARRLGYKHFFLDSSESGLSIYRKIGFRIYSISGIYGYKNKS